MKKNIDLLYYYEKSGLQVSPVTKFFNNLILTPKPHPSPEHREDMFPWALRYYTGYLSFAFGIMYHHFITWVTQYYPFSLLYPYSILHAKNKVLRKFVLRLEKIAIKAKFPLLITGNDYNNNMYIFDALLYKSGYKSKIDMYQTLLEEKFGTVYIRKIKPGQIRMIIPSETYQSAVSKKR